MEPETGAEQTEIVLRIRPGKLRHSFGELLVVVSASLTFEAWIGCHPQTGLCRVVEEYGEESLAVHGRRVVTAEWDKHVQGGMKVGSGSRIISPRTVLELLFWTLMTWHLLCQKSKILDIFLDQLCTCSSRFAVMECWCGA